ncbi:MAG: VOC family protein [Acidimicrobiales bacterium]
MSAHLFRCRMSDRPGALGQVASRIGSLRADIVSVAVHRHKDGIVVDEFLLMLPDEPFGLEEMLVAEIEQVDGVTVESHRLVDDGRINLTLTNVVWFELLSDDCDAAAAFYTEALGWRTEPVAPFGDGVYHVIFPNNGLTPAGGLVYSEKAARGSEAAGAVVYVETPDLDSALAAFEAAGGSVRTVTKDDPHSSAVVADPWGNRLGLWQT